MATFQTLPFDIHWEVVKHLDIESAHELRKCNRYFHDNINLQALPATSWKEFLSRAEELPENAELYACYTCKRLRPGRCFGDYQITSQRRGKAGRWTYTSHQNLKRYCWDCAAAHRLSPHSRGVRKKGRIYYLCWKCRRWAPLYRRCGVPDAAGAGAGEGAGRQGNHDYESPDWVCWSDDGSASLKALQALPLAIQRRVFALLGYRGAIALAQTSRHFRAYVEPRECAPLHDKFRFVRDLALRAAAATAATTASDSSNDEGRGEGEPPPPPPPPPQRLACYGCFRVRERAKFNSQANLDEAARPGRFWTRRCWECNARYFHQAAGAFRAELGARVVCGRCQLLKVRDAPCGGCREGAVRSAPVVSDLRSGPRGVGTALRGFVGVVAVDKPLLCCIPGLMFFFFSVVVGVYWVRVSIQRLRFVLGV